MSGFLVVASLTNFALATQTGGQAGDKPTPGQTGKPDPATQPRSATSQGSWRVYKHDQVIGSTVRNSSGEQVGKVEDLVVYSNGQVAYAVLSRPDAGAAGANLLAVPWSLFRTEAAAGAGAPGGDKPSDPTGKAAGGTDNEGLSLTLNLDKERFKNAPSFERAKWPMAPNFDAFDAADKYYETDIRAAESQRTKSQPVEASAKRTAGTAVYRLSELNNRAVGSMTGDRIGDIRTVYIDPTYGRVNYAVVSAGTFLGSGDRLVAIPWAALKSTRADNKDSLTLDITKEKLSASPAYKTEPNRANDTFDPMWVGTLYRYYSVPPYWDNMTPHSQPPDSKEPPKKN